MKRLLLAIATVAVAAGCSPYVAQYHYRVGVDMPTTAEAAACQRECMALFGACPQAIGAAPVIPVVGPHSLAYGCPGLVTDCMLTCPGAQLAADGPALIPTIVDPVEENRRKRLPRDLREERYGSRTAGAGTGGR